MSGSFFVLGRDGLGRVKLPRFFRGRKAFFVEGCGIFPHFKAASPSSMGNAPTFHLGDVSIGHIFFHVLEKPAIRLFLPLFSLSLTSF